MRDIEKGEGLFVEGKIEEAEKCFLDLLKNDPNNPEILNNLGVIQHAKSNLQEAEDLFLQALAVNEGYLDALPNLADLYQNAKRWKEACAYLEKYIEIENKDHNLFNQLGTIYLELGDTEKARAALAKSLELNPDQQIVADSLRALEKKGSTPNIETSEKPLNILFVQEAPCIRNYKMATALRSRGHRISLAYTKARLSQMYKGLSDDVYTENIQIANFRQLWDISKNYDIVHCHNEPDILTVAALAGEAPVIHDTHDLISLRANGDLNLSYFEGVANRGATGRVYTTPYQMEEAQKLYGVNGPSLVFYNYASETDLPNSLLPKRSTQDGKVHIVYEGGIGGNGHRDFFTLFVELAKLGNHIHIYPTFYDIEIARYFSEFPNIHYNNPLSPKQIIEAMSQFDFGIIPFNLEKGNKRFLDSTIANKLFEYLAAGLPVLASPLRSYIDYFSKNPVGITFQDEKDIITNMPRLGEIAERTDFSKQVFTYEREIARLEKFYRKIINSVSTKRGKATAALSMGSLGLKTKGQEIGIEERSTGSLKTGKSNLFRSIPQDLIVKNTSRRPLLDLAKTQWLSTEELEEIQNAFLRMLASEVYEKVPFYRRIMDETNTDPAGVNSIEDLRRMPIIDKDIIHDHYAEMQHVNFETLEKHYTGTGGSTGRTLKYFVPPEVYWYGFGCRNRGFSWAGFDESRDRVAYLAGGSLGVTNKVEIEANKLKIPATGITNKEVMEQYYEALKSFSPDYMRAYPSALYQFCCYLKEEGEELTLKRVVTTAETLFDSQRSFIEEILGCKIFNEYGAYDGGAGAFECERHCGLHLQMERGIVELLDPDGNPAKPGQAGRVIVTDLHNYLFPFIRYDVGDMAIASDRTCECGRGLRLIEGIEGRSSDYIVLGDKTKVSGEAVIHLFNRMLQTDQIDIKQYQVHQRSNRMVEIRVIPGGRYSSAHRERIYSTFTDHLQGVHLSVKEVDEINPAQSGKMRFVYSDIEANKIEASPLTLRVPAPSNVTQVGRTAGIRKDLPKICHIGGAHSVHVADIVGELDKLGYAQCIIGYYPVEKSITPKHIPVYYFPYRSYESPDWHRLKLEDKLEEFLDKIFKNEKPDIVHGHSLTYSCIPVWMAKIKFGLPTILVPWSSQTMKYPDGVANHYEKRCFESLDHFLHGMPNVFKLYQSYYGNLPDDKFVLFRPFIDLSPYGQLREISHTPKILSARVMGEFYRQDLLVKSIPYLIKESPAVRVTLIVGQNPSQGREYFEKMIQMAERMGVAQYCDFVPHSLSQKQFAELITSHNIIYCLAVHDEGFSGTTLQAAYSGAVTIVQDTPEIDGILDHEVNVLRTEIGEESVRETLVFAVNNLELLQERFMRENRKKLKVYGKENMLKNLTKCYTGIFHHKRMGP